MIEVKKITPQETYKIRLEVLRKGIDLPYKFKEDFDEDTFHLGAFLNDNLIGIVTLMKSNNTLFDLNQYQLRGMAALPDARGKGVGSLLLKTSIKILKENNCNILWCNAREVAIAFYKRQNFTIIGDSFYIEKVGVHYKMKKNLI